MALKLLQHYWFCKPIFQESFHSILQIFYFPKAFLLPKKIKNVQAPSKTLFIHRREVTYSATSTQGGDVHAKLIQQVHTNLALTGKICLTQHSRKIKVYVNE